MTHRMSDLERSELQCRRQDAAILKQTIAHVWQTFKAGHNPNADAMERAKLACQKRDNDVIRHAAASVGRPAAGHHDDPQDAAPA